MARKTTNSLLSKNVPNGLVIFTFIILMLMAIVFAGQNFDLRLLAANNLRKTGTLTGPSGQVKFGEVVMFSATWSKHVQQPRVLVLCYQNERVQFASLTTPTGIQNAGTTSINLGLGGISQWSLNGGGPADCTAQLMDYVGAPYTREIVPLSPIINFHAEG